MFIKNARLFFIAVVILAGNVFATDGENQEKEIANLKESVEKLNTKKLHKIEIFSRKTCKCCHKWGDHLKQNGFEVELHHFAREDGWEAESARYRAFNRSLGVSPRFESCHVGLIDGYVVTGHVPAEDIVRLLKERPNIRGLAASMLPGQPGMEHAGDPVPYRVAGFYHDTSREDYMIFADHTDIGKDKKTDDNKKEQTQQTTDVSEKK